MTVTDLITQDDPERLQAWFAAPEDGLARFGEDEPRAVPEGATPLVGRCRGRAPEAAAR